MIAERLHIMPWDMDRLRQSEWEACLEFLKGEGEGKGEGKGDKPRPRSTPCRADGCTLQAPLGEQYCSTHHRQMMASAVREANARREGSR